MRVNYLSWKASKRVRPASSCSSWSGALGSEIQEAASKRGKRLYQSRMKTFPYRSHHARSHYHHYQQQQQQQQHHRLTPTVTASPVRHSFGWDPGATAASGAAVISNVTTSPAAQPDETPTIGHQIWWEPTSVPELAVSFSGQAGLAARNTSPAYTDQFQISPTHFAPVVTVLTTLHQDPLQLWSSNSLQDSVPMFHQLDFHPSSHDEPPPVINQDNYPSPTGLPYHQYQPFNPPGTMVSSLAPDHTAPMSNWHYRGFQHFHSLDAHPISMNETFLHHLPTSMDADVDMDWQMVHPDDLLPGEDHGQTSPQGPSSGYTSPEELLEEEQSVSPPKHQQQLLGNEQFQLIPNPTDEPSLVDLTDGNTAPPIHPAERDRGLNRRRKALSPADRVQTGNTRRIGACVRCQMQRVRCIPIDGDERGICQTCASVCMDSKKRWHDTELRDLGPEDWEGDGLDAQPRTLRWSLGLCDNPIEFEVRRFKRQEGDVVFRKWKDPNGVPRETRIEPYALGNIQKPFKYFGGYIERNALPALLSFIEDNKTHWLVRKTYMAAWKHMASAGDVEINHVKVNDLVGNLFRLWFVTRQGLGSGYIVDAPGRDTLGMKVDTRDGYPYPGKISIPRMVSEQFNSICINYAKPLRELVLKQLWALMQSKQSSAFFTVYSAVFIILHLVSFTSKDRYRWARQNDYQVKGGHVRYNQERFVEQMHEGANMILLLWHYYRRNLDPLTHDWANSRLDQSDKDFYRDLTHEQVELMCELCRASKEPLETAYEKAWPYTKDQYRGFDLKWELDLYFVSQMFTEGWQPGAQWEEENIVNLKVE